MICSIPLPENTAYFTADDDDDDNDDELRTDIGFLNIKSTLFIEENIDIVS